MNKKKSSRKAIRGSDCGTPSDPTGTSNSANATCVSSNNAGNRNLAGTEEVDQATSDGVPFIFVDAMPLTHCPLSDPELAQIEAKRMAQVLAECDQLLERLEDTKPPPELDLPSTMTAVNENVDDETRFLEELQQLCIFPMKEKEQHGEEMRNFRSQTSERPGISRQATFAIDRTFTSLNERRIGGETPLSSPESMGIINQIGDLLVRLKQLQDQPLEEGTGCFFLVSIKPDAETSNCFVQQIGVPASLMAAGTESASSEIPIQTDTVTKSIPPPKTSKSRSKSRFGYVGKD
ncbi:uncharacterized protein LOC111065559 [Drosophila obscura]|uniref:uncharacterized protein LOC111065559 n=1 Tax=Drosophila obscura TaxID=7282 RepID=UPI001BB1B33E|nr:uncharacterized protein LOC111065559 [Drosophila obscura]XP_022209480.2 uncharacterized protein LOC111065559 [Drosophila obscura]